MSIHPSAIVDSKAEIATSAVIGPFCVVGPDVTIGERVKLRSHVNVEGVTTIGDDCEIYPFASIGSPPQDHKYGGERSTLEIGARNIIREHVTMNTGTEGGGMVTRVGDDGLFLTGAHVAHDCIVGNRVILVNQATLGGHVTVGDHVVIGGLSAVHQFVRVGAHAMIGGMTAVVADVIPFGSVVGDRGRLGGLNLVGMKRRGFSRETIHAMRGAYRDLFEETGGTLSERAEAVRSRYEQHADVLTLIDFVRTDSKRSFVT